MKAKYLTPQATVEDEIKAIGYYFEECQRNKVSIHTAIRSFIPRYERMMDWVGVSRMSRTQFNNFLDEGAEEARV